MTPRFAVGSTVSVRHGNPLGHVRTPFYIRGKSGTVERICGEFRDPQELAYGRAGEPKQVLYRVRFVQNHVWPDYAGTAHDTIDIELYEQWLEPPS